MTVVRTFLQQHHAREPIVQVPKVDAAHAALVVQVTVNVKGLVGLDLYFAHALARDSPLARTLAAPNADAAGSRTALVQRGVELVGPRRAVAVAVAVVVAEQVVAARLLAPPDRQRLVDGREEVLGQVGRKRDDGVEVVGRLLGVEPTEEVPGGGARDGMLAVTTGEA